MEKSIEKLNYLFNKYHISVEDANKILEVINPFFKHPEFERRMKEPFLHHADITLGEHILEDVIVTYLLGRKYQRKGKKINLSLALKIAIMHDLYTEPWQNSKIKHNYFFNKHGFTHPLEAVINAYCWYPESFEDCKERKILIDGILHHMYPLPVRRFILSKLELNNIYLITKLPNEIQEDIQKSLNRGKIFSISLSKSKYFEGRIISKADKKVSLRQIKNFYSFWALFTGKNKSIK